MPKFYSSRPVARSREPEARSSAAIDCNWPDNYTSKTSGLLAVHLVIVSVPAFILAFCLFLLSPQLDVAVADFFFLPGHGFIGHVPWVTALRSAFKGIFVAGASLAVFGLVFSLVTARPFVGLTAIRWIFLSLALSVGPGLIANVLLKDQLGRARPNDVEVFGGSKTFTAPLVAAKQCRRNCSFVSGEAASIFALFFALAFLTTRHSTTLICTALIMGALAGLIRMAQGAHFLSDVVFAGIFMCFSVAGLHLLIIDAQPLWRRAASTLADQRGRNGRNH